MSKLDRPEFTVTASTFTVYGNETNVRVIAPATLSAAQTITLSNAYKASGTGSTALPAQGQMVNVHRVSGTYANTTTIKNNAGTTIGTISTATGQDVPFQFQSSAWVSSP